jgi:hypothetical protein
LKKIRHPDTIAKKQTISTAPAAVSLIRAIFGLGAIEYRSHNSSMAVFTDSNPSTNALNNIIVSHSFLVMLRKIPNTETKMNTKN